MFFLDWKVFLCNNNYKYKTGSLEVEENIFNSIGLSIDLYIDEKLFQQKY